MGLLDWLWKKKEKSESLYPPDTMTPPVEHPLLTIQDKVSRLEEIYRHLDEKVELLATKEDAAEIKEMVSEGLVRGDDLIGMVSGIEERIRSLQEQKRELTHKIDASTMELTQNIGEVNRVERELELLRIDKKIVDSLKDEEMSTIELSKRLGYTRQHLWGRLKQLQEEGLVKSFKVGRQTKYRLIG